ncbi:hypothetical protein [Altererythrobacter sp. MF3-039]|uniref:hypothetical protein n=1 Tax=Altererythrobacter sp. MF3-039 TaxID=3252901 RepID=UPI00390C60A8
MAKSKSGAGPGNPKGESRNTRWQDHFIAELAQTSNVTRSAKAAGIDTASVYKLRRTSAGFCDKWQQALCEGYDLLEIEVLRRLREGDLTTEDGGKYDFGNALRILTAHRESAAKVRAQRSNTSIAEVRASIDRKVEEMRQRVLAREAEEGRIRAND